jgi:hypothetical protein
VRNRDLLNTLLSVQNPLCRQKRGTRGCHQGADTGAPPGAAPRARPPRAETCDRRRRIVDVRSEVLLAPVASVCSAITAARRAAVRGVDASCRRTHPRRVPRHLSIAAMGPASGPDAAPSPRRHSDRVRAFGLIQQFAWAPAVEASGRRVRSEDAPAAIAAESLLCDATPDAGPPLDDAYQRTSFACGGARTMVY